jgi:hypothetical protein
MRIPTAAPGSGSGRAYGQSFAYDHRQRSGYERDNSGRDILARLALPLAAGILAPDQGAGLPSSIT